MLLGKNAKIYYNTATYGSPTWVEISIFSDVNLDISFDWAEVPTRASSVKKGGKTLADVPMTGKVKQHLTDTTFLAIWAALISPTGVMDLLILNASSATNGARGVRGEFAVMSNKDDQSLGNGLVYDLQFKPADTDNAFSTAVVASAAPVFTNF